MSDPHDPLAADVELVTPGTLEALVRAEIDVQIATAKRYPRSIAQFKARALAMATMDEETAASCIYCRPVGMEKNKSTGQMEQKYAEGMSIRMAEIVGASYGNLRVGAMLIEQTDRQVKARGYAHDLESNFASGSEFIESTVTKTGQPFSERMRAVVARACIAKARRDATFQVVPRAICKPIEAAARKVAIGDEKSLASRRAAVVQWLGKLHIDIARVWGALNIGGPDDLTLEHLIILTGLKTAIKDNEVSIDEAFPPLNQPEEGKRVPAFTPVKKPKPPIEPEVSKPKTEVDQEVPDDSGLSAVPAPEPEVPEPMVMRTIQEDLRDECLKVPGCTWETFSAVAVQLGWINPTSKVKSFADLSDSTARKLYGARVGLAAELAKAVQKGIV